MTIWSGSKKTLRVRIDRSVGSAASKPMDVEKELAWSFNYYDCWWFGGWMIVSVELGLWVLSWVCELRFEIVMWNNYGIGSLSLRNRRSHRRRCRTVSLSSSLRCSRSRLEPMSIWSISCRSGSRTIFQQNTSWTLRTCSGSWNTECLASGSERCSPALLNIILFRNRSCRDSLPACFFDQ